MRTKIFILLTFYTACLLKAQLPQGIPKDGLQAFWPFSGNPNDFSGNNHHGKTNGVTLAKDRFGNDNSAYSFNGSSDYILTSYEGITGDHPRAVSFWAIVQTKKAGSPAVYWGNNTQVANTGGSFDCCFGGSYACTPRNTFIGPAIDVSDAGITYEGQEPVTDGKWHHYVYQFNKKYVKDVEIYQDGLLLTHEPYYCYRNCPLNTKVGAELSIGVAFMAGKTSYFKGQLDDIAIYDRMLTAWEIHALFTAADPHKKTEIQKEYFLKAQVPSSIPKKGLQAFWPFSGNANDFSGNNRHGETNGVTLTKDRFGNDSSAYSFNGYSDCILTTYEGILGNHPRAVSFWAIVKKTKIGIPAVCWGSNAQFPNAGGRFDCCFGGCYLCHPEDTLIGPGIDASDAGITFESQDPIDDGKWHHYVYQFNKKLVRDVEIYQDGLLLTHEPYRFYRNCPLNTRHGANVSIGVAFVDTKTPYFKGLLDDIAIYDRALSAQEIYALYTAPDPHKKTALTKWVFVILSIILVVILIIWFIRLRVKILVSKEKEKIQIEKKWYEQENRVLKAQMDPHFIFNSLNSIQQFIIVNDNEKAQLYLSTFAQLIRMQLESNTNENITLKQEIEILEKYLEIESLRFNNAFDHEIVIDKTINTGSFFIPYFLIQPFVENAIHHGLLPKLGYKELTITIEIEDDKTLKCTVDDNGIGRNNSGLKETPFKTKSLGVTFVQQRLLIMSKIENRNYSVEITDKINTEGASTGTRAVIRMPIQSKI